MNVIRPIRFLLCAGVWAGLVAGLAAGCASPAASNQKVYDRYAELLAQRNRQLTSPAPATAPARPAEVRTPAPAGTSRPSAAPIRRPSAPSPSATKPVSAPPVQVMAPPPAVRPESRPAVPVASAVAEDALPDSGVSDGVYQLKVGDVVQVFLRGIPTPEVVDSNIDEHGMISLPLINEVQAAGQSASELARSIRQIYLDRGLYKNISVTVAVPTRFYFIQGEIRSPGRYQLVAATRLSQAIAGAAGYTEYASGQVLVRRGGKVFKIIRNARRLERSPEDDILLEPDDIIEVKRSLW